MGRERITNTFLIPNMMRRLMDNGVFADPAIKTHLKAVHTGAGLLRMPDKQLFTDLLPDAELYFRYGLTEAGPMVTRLKPEDMLDPAVDGSIGPSTCSPRRSCRIRTATPVRPGELGEICVSGPSLMTGYYGRPELPPRPSAAAGCTPGIWPARDERGYYFFRDRLKEMIKTGGENVYAAEIEQALYLHPAVLEAAVVGVPDPRGTRRCAPSSCFAADCRRPATDLSAFLRGQPGRLQGSQANRLHGCRRAAALRGREAREVPAQTNLGWGA